MNELTLGVIARSRKDDEHRLPIHPLHVDRIPAGLRARVYLEDGYGTRFGVSDDDLAPLVAGLRSREQLIADCDVVLLAKPLPEDVAELHPGQVLWGWPHCVQDEELTQYAIDRRFTLIAFEAMNHWSADGSFNLHVFHKNNELAGYCSVLHALATVGRTGDYGRRLRAAVIGFGATGRGAVTALNALGVYDVDVLTHRGVHAVESQIHSARMVHFEADDVDPSRSHASTDAGVVPLAGFLADHDIIVNCVLQDPNAPLTFLTEDDLPALAPGSLDHRRLLRRGDGVQLGAADVVRPAHLHGRHPCPLLRRRPQPLLPVGLGVVGDQRGPVAAPADGARRARRVEGERDDPARHRDPRGCHPEPQHPVLPAPRPGVPARA